jgi:GNAT superfamily N-acetyltransferase
MMASVLVRPARTEDGDAVWPLARELATSYDVQLEAYARVFALSVEADDALVLVAECDGAVIGYLLGQAHHTFHANGHALWVEELMVRADHRGAGVGRALMAAAEDWARERGAAYVALATRRAADFYLALDFEASATYFKRRL